MRVYVCVVSFLCCVVLYCTVLSWGPPQKQDMTSQEVILTAPIDFKLMFCELNGRKTGLSDCSIYALLYTPLPLGLYDKNYFLKSQVLEWLRMAHVVRGSANVL